MAVMEANLYTKLDDLTDSIHANHTEVVQRLTALETKLEGLEKLPDRVSALENDRAGVRGGWAVGTVIINALITVVGFLFRRHA